jgi:hypothetical protein
VTPGKLGLILGAVAVVAIVAGIATAFVLNELLSEDEQDSGAWVAPPEGWLTYRDEEGAYEISYPPDWVVLKPSPPFANLALIPEGDSGLPLPRPTEVYITVRGLDLFFVRLTFEPGPRGAEYYVTGRGRQHEETLLRIVQSFRFLD